MTHHCKHCNFSSNNPNTINFHAVSSGHVIEWDLVERTEDWIPDGYIIEDVCQHGIYKLVAPRKIICTNCQTVIIDTQEMDGIADWMYALCRGA